MKETKTIKKSKSWSIGSLVCGILGITLCPMPYFALPLSILAIVFRCKDKQSTMATAGMVCGIIGVVLNAICLFILFIALAVASTF